MTLYKHPIYNLQNDLAPVVLVADQPTILVARKDFPVDGLQGLHRLREEEPEHH